MQAIRGCDWLVLLLNEFSPPKTHLENRPSMELNLKGRAISYSEPALFLLMALYGAILAAFDLLFEQRRPQDLLNLSKFADHAFGTFWLMVAPQLAEREVEKGVPALVASATGTIIEIGPGSGNQVSRYDRSKVTKIYGIEPTASLHPQLRENIKRAGLSDVYTIVPCGVQDVDTLRRYGVDQEAFDTVLSVQVFCSVPHPKETAAALWKLLKPGGTMIFYEHVKSRDLISSKVQDFYNIVWPYALQGCCLNRDTARTFREAGDWAKVDIQLSAAEDAWLAIPHILGRLTKAS